MALFGKKEETAPTPVPAAIEQTPSAIIVITAEQHGETSQMVGGVALKFIEPTQISPSLLLNTRAVVVHHLTSDQLRGVYETIVAVRTQRGDHLPGLIVSTGAARLTELGQWLQQRGVQGELSGVRLIAAENIAELTPQISDKLEYLGKSNIVRMPIAPEVEHSPMKYFFLFSPDLHRVVNLMGELAENNISRVYLLGAPGTGKTTLAYYFFLKRGRGNFVTVNLSSENNGDKGSMKSLLCGHVTGAMPGAPAREGALSFSRDGVCFLDESHGATGTVMQVLMEVLESGQFLPFGATAKRMLECAVIFASNRSWETLRGMMHLDEHARLGATAVGIPDLAKRPEDQIAITAATLAKFQSQCTTWKPPSGLTPGAWKMILSCPWKGNTRTLIRVIESACVAFASEKGSDAVLGEKHIGEGLKFWEPDEAHPDDQLYTHY